MAGSTCKEARSSLSPPSACGTSPKFDKVKSECGFKPFIVGFGGGWVGVVDFYCHKADLVLEVDGDIHDLQQEEDALRERVLREMGLTVVRFRNEDVIQDLLIVVERIRSLISV